MCSGMMKGRAQGEKKGMRLGSQSRVEEVWVERVMETCQECQCKA